MSKAKKKKRLRLRPNVHNRWAPPGTIYPGQEAQESELNIFAYGNSGELIEKKISSLTEIKDLVGKFKVLWLDVTGLKNSELIIEIGKIFDLHALALEDAVNQHQVIKCENYDKFIFFVIRILGIDGGAFNSEQISIFLGDGFVISFSDHKNDCFANVKERIRKPTSKIAISGSDYLFYSLIDATIDSYFPVVDKLADQLDSLEERIGVDNSQALIGSLHHVRNNLLYTRRTIRPIREAISQLTREESQLIKRETLLFLRDCADHSIQLIELLETYRELCADLRDYSLTMISFKMNEIMKVLTIIATIFIPLSFIASVYGMNFDTNSPWNMPELSWYLGYPFALFLMLTTALGFLYFFWNKGWIRPFERNKNIHLFNDKNDNILT